MNDKPNLKLGLVFSFIIFSIMFVSSVLTAILAIFFHPNFSSEANKFLWPIIDLSIISIIVGTTISAIIGKKILAPLVKFSEAIMEVGKGNFNIKLDEDKYYYVEELKKMSQNFNIMVDELNNIETFRSDFIANVSHEFKTPLASIEGYTTLLQDNNLSKEEKSKYTDKILNNTKRLSSLVGSILQISRLENQDIIAERSRFKLDEQLRQTLLLLESKWSNKNIDLDIDLDSITFHGNEELLMQVWINILSNAIKFTPEDGTIRCTLKKDKNWITTSISDNGIGMNEDTQKHIFDKFYQGDKSHSSEGNGLGLALVKRIIDLCGGKIEVYSECKKGSTFVIKLPC
ncbi:MULTISPECIES: HAMP domain-containing sensor histidine kinase [Clostridium]|jgi:Signal transduction histidine kinase|uniref:histidine kinase n=2 Tax=Clostridium beijerinckii TaxID=1520 RepID=A0A1S8RKX7_CLOBE|nr:MULTISPECIES: HAMP domain-containing sensor histidine kinase [Clostridium]ABR34630.1 integral membrane sensor signal transduction histidine kinase [Clostridium beijerinckii NCIMB 8052]AIU01863.1 integral membrane sensor signal transduction histidine kinase [Clostridium beijerinckii ATCC 35702]MBF7810742.1 HAMP domain-containing histidine kinase [Clostridium beijerinckii]NOW91466.1 signal transduction histidine kinase [Clostridium beijerinckii]NRT24026.1 signal transduction histidine kinase 